MSLKSKRCFLFIGSTILLACIVHAFFISQLMLAMSGGGSSQGDWGSIFFYPHLILMYILPPHSFNEEGLTGWKFIGKTIGTFPASLLYGAVITLALFYLYDKFHHAKNEKAGN
jgi:hypothetical protein